MRQFVKLLIWLFFCIVFIDIGSALADAESQFSRGQLFYEKELYGAAILQFNRFLDTYPDDARHSVAVLNIGKSHFYRRDYEQAEKRLQKLWQEDRTPYFNKYIDDLFSYLIETKIILGKIEEADQLTQGYTLRYWVTSAYTEILFRMAEAWYMAGDFSRANRYLIRMEERKAEPPHPVYIAYLKGIIGIAQDDRESIEKYFKRVLDSPISIHNKPEEIVMLKDQARLKLAEFYFQQGEFYPALDSYASIKSWELLGDRRYLGMAWSHFMVLEYEKTVDYAKKLIDQYPQSIYLGEAEFLQGVCYLDMEDPIFAVERFENFFRLIADFDSEAKILGIEAQIAEEREKSEEMNNEIRDLEEALVYLSSGDADRMMSRILRKKEQIEMIERGVAKIEQRLDQRKTELQLKVEAEYGLSKAKLLSTHSNE
ncbi:MAG: hypothetical protein B6244_05160 [Candidatus Cloacimonetes bacterium 4572_55]|nr:MAG: hypothetical protein B6244_05160 [Candidatus Cloacimonetes bacterium 4572_55]